MKPVQLFCFLFLIGLSSCFGNFKDGEAYFRNGDYEKAIREFNRALFLSVNDLKSLHLRARAYEELEEYEKALSDYRTIIKFDPTYAQALAGIGKIAWKLDEMKMAEKNLLLAAMHDPEDYEILLLLGRTMIKNQRFGSAEEFLGLASEQKPKEPMPYYYLGIARGYMGDGLGVITAFNQYLKLDPDNINAHFNRGFALMKLGFEEWAVEDFNVVLKKNPRHYEAMARRGICLLETRPRQACEDLQKAAQNGSSLAKANLKKCR